MHRELMRLVAQSEHLVMRHKWKGWYESCFYSHLHTQYEKVKGNKLSPTRLYLRLAEGKEDNPKAILSTMRSPSSRDSSR